jgi:outer membrane lipoprotein-sorting protein
MLPTRQRGALLAALVVASLTAGCIGGLSADGSVDAAAVGDQVEQRYAALNGYEATVTRTVEVGDRTTTASADVAVDVGDGRRVAYTAGPRAGETVATRADAGPVFDAGVAAGSPATPASYGALAETLVRASDVSVERVTDLDGHRSAVVELSPASNATAAANVTRTVWVDLDRRVPLKVTTSWTTGDGRSAEVTVEYDDVALYEGEETPFEGDASAARPAGVVA